MFTEGKTSEIKHQNVDVSLDKEKYSRRKAEKPQSDSSDDSARAETSSQQSAVQEQSPETVTVWLSETDWSQTVSKK